MTPRSDACTITGHARRGSPGGSGLRRMSFLELAPLPSAVPCARLHAVHVLRDWDLRDLADDAALIVSDSLNLASCSYGRF